MPRPFSTAASDADLAHATSLRRRLHRHPELQFEEHDTAALVASELRELGYSVRTGVAGTGVVADLQSRPDGRCLALRADMDALPITERTGLPHASAQTGKMHACGHDGHTASLLLAARLLARERDSLNGRVRLIFQPAEETGQGAAAMVAAGALEDVDAIFAYHNRPGLPQGQIALRPGPTCGGGDRIEVVVHGAGGHASRPHLGVDPIYVASLLIQAWHGMMSRHLSALSSGVLSITSLQAGSPANGGSIPSRCDMLVNLRYDSPETRERLTAQLTRLAEGLCAAHGARFELRTLSSIPAVVNDDAMTNLAIAALRDGAPGPAHVLSALPTLGGEDFSFYLDKVPGCLFFVGVGETHPDLHSDIYDFCDAVLPVAAGAYARIAHAFLAHR